MITHCPSCDEELADAGARFCEACGYELGEEPGFGPCVRCGEAVGDDGYCSACGFRAVEPIDLDDRGTFAYATHRGRRHDRNEDSAALARTAEGWPILIVSDGVSASPNPHMASANAVAAAAGHLDGKTFGGEEDLAKAVALAHEAASATPDEGDPNWPPDGTHPACTLVLAVAAEDAVHVANVGDARTYLVSRNGEGEGDSEDHNEGSWAATQLSTDDSVAAEAVAMGMELDKALALPGGHGITAWLGADAREVVPHVSRHEARPGDLLLACSDGLWNYASTDETMSQLLNDKLSDSRATDCEQLVAWAIDQGGSDNITIALAPVTAEPQEIETPEETA